MAISSPSGEEQNPAYRPSGDSKGNLRPGRHRQNDPSRGDLALKKRPKPQACRGVRVAVSGRGQGLFTHKQERLKNKSFLYN